MENDQLYINLMARYKRERHYDRHKANKLLEQARTLPNVSKKAKLAGAYI